MTGAEPFALLVVLLAAVGLVAVLSNRLAHRVKLPAPALFLVGAAIAAKVVPALHGPSQQAVERVVTVALACILFDGGMNIGWARFRSAAVPIAVTGVLGTFLTVIAAALLAHFAFGLAWYVSLLVATAVAPTDPAVVFSVLGQREVSGRAGIILKGESGANDPVGIALMAEPDRAPAGVSAGAFAHVGGEFLVQMAVGVAVGVAGGRALLWFTRRVPLPSEGLYPLRTLACVLLLFGVATLAHGSGFLAVFTAGIVLGDERAPFKREIELFHAALASLAEIVAFIVLGLTINLGVIARADVWVPGLILGAALAVRHPAGPGRAVPAPGPAEKQRARLRPVRRAQRSRADPAGQLPARRPRARRRAAVRHRRGCGRVLRRGARQPDARRRPAAPRPHARDRARAMGAGGTAAR